MSLDLITVKEACSKLKQSKSTIYRLIGDPKVDFPKPVKMPRGRTCFIKSEIEAYVNTQLGARKQPE